ncbi:hypothetical protein AXG93_2789s1110 [Marchantia polymorpha subsp. ruderalis]|uniref:Uncharacterized protein n=1 Tax=Marchantia polymorpha subsp. ruderalis TaxID=1480154 RepID=A0A176W9F4_MARPO|nr:hypothetical protein AXG93_2789s1110 [Marchantia polymorpha subsp. ruderalis]
MIILRRSGVEWIYPASPDHLPPFQLFPKVSKREKSWKQGSTFGSIHPSIHGLQKLHLAARDDDEAGCASVSAIETTVDCRLPKARGPAARGSGGPFFNEHKSSAARQAGRQAGRQRCVSRSSVRTCVVITICHAGRSSDWTKLRPAAVKPTSDMIGGSPGSPPRKELGQVATRTGLVQNTSDMTDAATVGQPRHWGPSSPCHRRARRADAAPRPCQGDVRPGLGDEDLSTGRPEARGLGQGSRSDIRGRSAGTRRMRDMVVAVLGMTVVWVEGRPAVNLPLARVAPRHGQPA